MTREFRLTACDDIAGIRILSLVGPADFSFRAGQYVVFEHPDGGIPMSIASSPGRLPHIVFHYRSTPGVPEAARFDALLDAGGPFDVDGPFGDVWIDRAQRDQVIIAGGTGASQARALLDQLRLDPPAVTLWWSVSEPADLYQDTYLAGLERDGWLDYRAFIDSRRSGNQLLPWLETVDVGPLLERDVVLCGPPPFVYAVFDTLTARGMRPEQFRSDVFDYAPR